MNLGQLRWYRHRLGAMAPGEIGWRVHDQVRHLAWTGRRVRPGRPGPAAPPRVGPAFPTPLPVGAVRAVPAEAAAALVAQADRLMAGTGEILGVHRRDLAAPDWFADPVTGRRAPQQRWAVRIDPRSREECGDVKQVWELSRHQHLTVLAGAWAVTGDDEYARVVDRQLRSWWRENPFLRGVHWTSGIELGLRLVSWVWVRRLLDGWPGAPDLFEDNPDARRQVFWHQRYLSVFRSRGSSANNHVVAEAVGQVVAGTALPWFARSGSWRAAAARLFEHEIVHNTFPDGLDREQASDYHGFVAELGLVAAVELAAAGLPVSDVVWERLCRMVDAAAAVLDETGRAPRQGDSDEGRALVVDPPAAGRWNTLLALGSTLFGPAPWWPSFSPDVTSTLVGALGQRGALEAPGEPGVRRPVTVGRPARRPSHFPDAGLTVLRTVEGDRPEIWCRCDGGPHGFLAIGGHAHADALSVEVRWAGVDVLADPGTYCYHGEPGWRRYFRSTLGHNTVELEGRDQSLSGGPFLWLRHAATTVLDVDTDDDAATVRWSAVHDGYGVLDPPTTHRRTVVLDRLERSIEIVDRIDMEERAPTERRAGTGERAGGASRAGPPATRRVTAAFHLGPAVRLEWRASAAELWWPHGHGTGSACLYLAEGLHWTEHRGESDPPLGWYSARFGSKEPTVTLLGTGWCGPGPVEFTTRLCFSP